MQELVLFFAKFFQYMGRFVEQTRFLGAFFGSALFVFIAVINIKDLKFLFAHFLEAVSLQKGLISR